MFFTLNKKRKNFFYYHFLAVIFFGLLYYLQDYFITNYSILAKKLKIIPEDYDASLDEVDDIFYYLWFSLITQTTSVPLFHLLIWITLAIPFQRWNSF